MAHNKHYRCPDCGGTFRHLHHPDDSPPPDRCPLCHAWVSEEPEPVFVPLAPGIRKSTMLRSQEMVFRQMESASAARAEEAADMLGVPKQEMAHLKITDMHDNMREGDIAAKMPVVAPEVANNPSLGFNTTYGGGPMPNYQPSAGPMGMGHVTRERTVAQHFSQMQDVVRAGTMGTYTPPKR